MKDGKSFRVDEILLKGTRSLSDSELGRFFRAMMEYAFLGKAPDLNGREAVAIEIGLAIIDTEREEADKVRETTKKQTRERVAKHRMKGDAENTCNALQGEKGTCNACNALQPLHGKKNTCNALQALHSPEISGENVPDVFAEPQNPTPNIDGYGIYNIYNQKNNINNQKDHHNNNDNDKDIRNTGNISGGCCGGGQEDVPFIADEEATVIQGKHNQVLDAARACGFPVDDVTMGKLVALMGEYTPDWVQRAIDIANDNGKPTLVYLRGILRNWKSRGGPDAEKPVGKAKADGKKMREQQYHQREYEASVKLPDWMKKYMEDDNDDGAGKGPGRADDDGTCPDAGNWKGEDCSAG